MTEEMKMKFKLNSKYGKMITEAEFKDLKIGLNTKKTNATYVDTDSIFLDSIFVDGSDKTPCFYDHSAKLVGEGYGHIQPNVDDDLF